MHICAQLAYFASNRFPIKVGEPWPSTMSVNTLNTSLKHAASNLDDVLAVAGGGWYDGVINLSRKHSSTFLTQVYHFTQTCIYIGHFTHHAHITFVVPGSIPSSIVSLPLVVPHMQALFAGFLEADKICRQRHKVSGTTATLAIAVGWELFVANVGDSGAYLDTGKEVIAVSGNHRIDDNAAERARVIAAGGRCRGAE